MAKYRRKQELTPEECRQRAIDHEQARYYGSYDRKESRQTKGSKWVVPCGFRNLEDFLKWRKSMGLPHT